MVTILGQGHLLSTYKKAQEKNFNTEPYGDNLSIYITAPTFSAGAEMKTWISNYAFHINIVKKQLGNRISRENFTRFRQS